MGIIYELHQMLHLCNTDAPDAPTAGGMSFIVPMIAILVIFFWLTHRSQKKKDRERREMLDSIKAGDDVMTIGGIHGRVTSVGDDTVEVRVNAEKDVKVRISKGAVNKVVKDEGQ